MGGYAAAALLVHDWVLGQYDLQWYGLRASTKYRHWTDSLYSLWYFRLHANRYVQVFSTIVHHANASNRKYGPPWPWCFQLKVQQTSLPLGQVTRVSYLLHNRLHILPSGHSQARLTTTKYSHNLFHLSSYDHRRFCCCGSKRSCGRPS